MEARTARAALVGTLLLAAALRAPNVVAARPYINYADEGNFLHPAAARLRYGGWQCPPFPYPTLPCSVVLAATRLYAPVYRAVAGHDLRDDLHVRPVDRTAGPLAFDPTNRRQFDYDRLEPFALLAIGRLATFVASLGAVAVAGLLGRQLAGATAGVCAALLAAVVPALVARGGIAAVDPFATLFVGACCAFTAATLTSSRPWRPAVAAGLCIGAAFTAKYTAVLVAIVPAVALFASPQPWRQKVRLLALAAAASIAGAVATMPMLVLQPADVATSVLRQAKLYRSSTPPSLWTQAVDRAEWNVHFGGPELGWAFLVVAALALAAALASRRQRPLALALLVFAIVVVTLFARQGFQPFRNLLPLVPLACALIGALFVGGADRLRRGWLAPAATVALALSFAPSLVTYEKERLALVDSRRQVVDWLAAHVDAEDRVLVLAEASFLDTELRRLSAKVARVRWRDLESRLAARRFDYLVLARLKSKRGQPTKPLADPRIQAAYRLRASFGEQPAPLDLRYWSGNRQELFVLEARPAGVPRVEP